MNIFSFRFSIYIPIKVELTRFELVTFCLQSSFSPVEIQPHYFLLYYVTTYIILFSLRLNHFIFEPNFIICDGDIPFFTINWNDIITIINCWSNVFFEPILDLNYLIKYLYHHLLNPKRIFTSHIMNNISIELHFH